MNIESSTNGSPREAQAGGHAAAESTAAGDHQALEAILTELKAMRQELSMSRSVRQGPMTPSVDPADQKTRADLEYRERLREIGNDYMATRAVIQGPTGIPGDLLTSTEVLARAAAITDVCADGGSEMWPVAAQTIRVAARHYATFTGSADALGVTDALAADDYYILRHLEASHVPEEDLEILRRAGVRDPVQYVRSMVRRARAVPDAFVKAMDRGSVHPREAPMIVVLADGGQFLQRFVGGDNEPQKGPVPPPKKRKTWSAIGKILKGAAIAAGNLVPVAAAAGIFAVNPPAGALAAAGALPAWDKILSSCGAGVGDICEGVGAIRGEG
jgi:hypothetical protein